MKFNIYKAVADRIIAELEQGNIPWQKPWEGGVRARNYISGHTYSLLNQMLLGGEGEWATYKQITEMGGKVKKGAKSKMVVFFTFVETEKEGKNGETITETIPFLRYYNVFDIVNDAEGIVPHEVAPRVCKDAEAILNGYVERSGVHLLNRNSTRAYYRPSADEIVLPMLHQFAEPEEYYSTAFHEAAHSTGHVSRLNRLSDDAFGSEAYSTEELIAELAAATLMMEADCDTEKSFKNSAGYVQGWLKALRNDPRLIVRAAGRAEKAVKMILGE